MVGDLGGVNTLGDNQVVSTIRLEVLRGLRPLRREPLHRGVVLQIWFRVSDMVQGCRYGSGFQICRYGSWFQIWFTVSDMVRGFRYSSGF